MKYCCHVVIAVTLKISGTSRCQQRSITSIVKKKYNDATINWHQLARGIFWGDGCTQRYIVTRVPFPQLWWPYYLQLESYWTYELCHGRYIRQYHEERDGKKHKLQEYYLGKWDKKQLAELSMMLSKFYLLAVVCTGFFLVGWEKLINQGLKSALQQELR